MSAWLKNHHDKWRSRFHRTSKRLKSLQLSTTIKYTTTRVYHCIYLEDLRLHSDCSTDNNKFECLNTHFVSYSADKAKTFFSMAIAFRSPQTSFFQLKKSPETHSLLRFSSRRLGVLNRRFTTMAAVSISPTVGLSETFTRLKKQGKVSKHFAFCSVCHFHFHFLHWLLSISIDSFVFPFHFLSISYGMLFWWVISFSHSACCCGSCHSRFCRILLLSLCLWLVRKWSMR